VGSFNQHLPQHHSRLHRARYISMTWM
jgi:hypothetical protein